MGDVQILIAEAWASGLRVSVDGERLVVRGPRRAERVALQLIEREAEVRAAVDAEAEALVWRVEAMRPRVPARGPIPFLVVREVAVQPDCCLSCGDPLEADHRYRCGPCARATALLLNEIREGVE
jgi:hypothetical protein